MLKSLYFHTFGIYIIFSVILHSFNCLSSVKMTVTVNTDSMTLSCTVTERDFRKKIYLFCPHATGAQNCRENCVDSCVTEKCRADSLIQCRDVGLGPETGSTQIDYVIDGSRSENHGKWKCQYGGTSSSVIYVNASSSKTVKPNRYFPATWYPPETLHIPKHQTDATNEELPKMDNYEKKPSKASINDGERGIPIDKLLGKSEFIITVIGLLALSLIVNVFFCIRMIVVHCRSQKKTSNSSQYFSMNPHNPPYNHSNSQVSDPDRIYEDTSINHRQMSFLTQIKNANGSYLAPNTLSPGSGLSTMLPHLSFNQPIPFANSPSDSGSTQMNHPLLSDPMQANYASVNFPTENSYTNFVSVQPDMCRRDGSSVPQPVYLAFQSPHPMMTAGNRYVQYSSQPLQSMALMSTENRLGSQRTEPSSSSSVILQSTCSPITKDDSKSNYQLSREMMEEADTLLRTADTLLKCTENEMKYFPQ